MPEIQIQAGVALPGEAIVVKLLEIVKVLIEKEPPEAAVKRWEWFEKDYDRWRKFWRLE